MLGSAIASLGLVASLGCSDRGGHEIAIDGDAVARSGPTDTDDGWALTIDSMVVVLFHPGLIEQFDWRPTWARDYGVSVWDVAATEADGDVVIAQTVRATEYDGFDFAIMPPRDGGYEAEAGNVDDATVEAMVEDQVSLRVTGSATDGMATVGFDWSFAVDRRFRCRLDDATVTVPADGMERSTIEILGGALFQSEAGALEFAAIAAADGDGDGNVTLDELGAAGLRETIEARANEVGSVRGGGACIDPVDPPEDG